MTQYQHSAGLSDARQTIEIGDVSIHTIASTTRIYLDPVYKPGTYFDAYVMPSNPRRPPLPARHERFTTAAARDAWLDRQLAILRRRYDAKAAA